MLFARIADLPAVSSWNVSAHQACVRHLCSQTMNGMFLEVIRNRTIHCFAACSEKNANGVVKVP